MVFRSIFKYISSIKHSSKGFLVIFLLLQIIPSKSFATTSRNLTIFTEPNMMLAMTEIARIYARNSNAVISVYFNSSYELISAIDLGEPADLFISAHRDSIKNLRQKGLVDVYNVEYFARDQLALVANIHNNKLTDADELVTIEDYLNYLNANRSTLITDYEGNSSGTFSVNYIKNLNLDQIKLFKKIAEDKSSITDLIKSDSTQYGLLFASQAKNDKDFKILAMTDRKDIFYQALVIAGNNMEIAREFLRFLKSNQAKEILRKNGFIAN